MSIPVGWLVGWINVPFQHKYGYIRDDVDPVTTEMGDRLSGKKSWYLTGHPGQFSLAISPLGIGSVYGFSHRKGRKSSSA